MMAGAGHLKRICKDAFSVAGAVQKTCSWEMLGGQGAGFLRGVAFWSIRSVGLLRWLHLHYNTLLSTPLYSTHYTTTTTTLHYTTLIVLHYITPPQMQLQLHDTNYTTAQLQPHHTTTTAALHHTTAVVGEVTRRGDHCNHCNHSKKHSSKHLSVHQWIRAAIRDSQQPSSPIGFLFWNFRHRLVRYYWYI